ncbi:hypothetical protein A2914_02220 [Candidatus Nomurabacteria bacterium RIFCSPLOWO2_01_FULL_41_21]|uniref:Uncharacterized protein n=2 Tax=Candidatus Nomuraibacteriota TaxID=1752729 RepID=A0A1F6V2K8_9BACT|nr:MAG: hypothetical protein A2733_01610 [Candidatus Nomurabacteria bacterium RIFCSPHIGHO2_01_FULL_40_20]OGI88744.1 MAG: hypothetical protein A2914_02220 [Candidatus Nomurabacteria bacterium RIFCSPLOWO2_01_FULL_41_21]
MLGKSNQNEHSTNINKDDKPSFVYSIEKTKQLLSLLINRNLTLLNVDINNRSYKNGLFLNYGSAQDKLLFTIILANEKISEIKSGDKLGSFSDLLTKENILKAWGTIGIGETVMFDMKENKVIVSTLSKKDASEIPLDGEIKPSIDEAMDKLFKNNRIQDYRFSDIHMMEH